MFNLSIEQQVAILIMLAYFAGGLSALSVFYYLIKRSEDAGAAKHRKPKMDKDADLEHVESALRYTFIPAR